MTQHNQPSDTTVHEGAQMPGQRQGRPGHHPGTHPDTVGVHGMLLAGTDPVYGSHLPMFMPPHNYQVLLKLGLEPKVLGKIRDLRAHFGRDTLITMAPRPFDITDLSPTDPSHPALTEFRADVVRGHFEHDGDIIGQDTTVRVEQVVHFSELPLDAGAAAPRGDLEYLIFGDAERELYLAHRVLGAPDFDQVLIVDISGADFTERELDREGRPTLTVPGRADIPEQRLQAGDKLAAHTSAGQHFHTDVEVEVVQEMYFMADELT
jgi:hypothetical protein